MEIDLNSLDQNYLRQLVAKDQRTRAARERVRAMRGTSRMVNLITTGATGQMLPALWAPSGAGKNILTGTFSYANPSTDDLVGGKADGYANTHTARQLATEAYFRGAELAARSDKLETDVIGVAMSSAVTTDRVRDGKDRVHIALREARRIWVVDVELDKPRDYAAQGEEHRIEQGAIADWLTLNAILAVLDLPQVDLPEGGMHSDQFVPGTPHWLEPRELALPSDYLRDPFDKVLWPDGTVTRLDAISPEKHIWFPATLDPITYAHDHMARAIRRPTGGRTAVMQLSLAHPNKVVTAEDLVGRASQLMYRHPVVLLRGHGLYAEKAELVPGTPMMAGADAIMEMMEERHYGGYLGLIASLKRMFQLGTEFYVNGRVCKDGVYRECDDLKLVGRYSGMFHPFTERLDVSSTGRRAAMVGQSGPS